MTLHALRHGTETVFNRSEVLSSKLVLRRNTRTACRGIGYEGIRCLIQGEAPVGQRPVVSEGDGDDLASELSRRYAVERLERDVRAQIEGKTTKMGRHGGVYQQPATRGMDFGSGGMHIGDTEATPAHDIDKAVAPPRQIEMRNRITYAIGVDKASGRGRDRPRIPSFKLMLGQHHHDRLSFKTNGYGSIPQMPALSPRTESADSARHLKAP